MTRWPLPCFSLCFKTGPFSACSARNRDYTSRSEACYQRTFILRSTHPKMLAILLLAASPLG
jgi:hypothetical protein